MDGGLKCSNMGGQESSKDSLKEPLLHGDNLK